MKGKYRFYIVKDGSSSRMYRKDTTSIPGRQWSWTFKNWPNEGGFKGERKWFEITNLDLLILDKLVEIDEAECMLYMI